MGRRDFYEEEKLKKLVYVFSVVLVLSVVLFLTIFVMYNKRLKNESMSNLENLGMMEDIVPNDEIEETSFSDDLAIQDTQNITNTNSTTNTSTNKSSTNTVKNVVNTEPVSAVVENTTNEVPEEKTEEVVEELSFSAPVSGEISKDFALDTLIYSNTLEEWTTHSGIDIKADKTTIVTASEAGTVESIKNDPRYGLTITISHRDGFKTIYSNLLTSEFVTENETVEKGQTIGTVGESSSFEIADEPHLHFEMYKDGTLVNPTIYLK